MRLVLLSLVVLMSLIYQYNCLPRKPIPKKDSNVEINDEVRRLMDLLEKKTNTYKQDPAKERTGIHHIPTIAKHRPTHVKQEGTGACGGVPERLSASSGTIQSPGYDSSSYPNDVTCQWIIEAPAGKMISVTVGEMTLEYCPNCAYDSVTLYDGSTESSTVLKKLCTTTASVTSSGSTVLVVFKSDYSVNSGRFSLSWTFVGQGGGGPGPQCRSPAIEPDVTFSRIIGGREAKPNSWPWQCYLEAGGYACGASVISNNYVLTAAHCVYKLGVGYLSNVKVHCGVHDIYTMYNDPKAQHITDVTVTIHEQYASANQYGYYGFYDIAVVRLNTPLTFSDYVQPACLPSTPIPDGTECVLTGFGKTAETGYGSNVLKQVVVPTINYDDCKRIYEAARKILPHDVICLGVPAGGKSACHGDSGGPMVCKRDGKWWQYGVTDFVWSKTSCAGPNQPFGYADVVAYLPWIQQNSGVGASARIMA